MELFHQRMAAHRWQDLSWLELLKTSFENFELNSRTPDQRLDSVQFMRFLAAFLVLITHCGFYVHERLDESFEYWRRGSSGVGLFFVISGFVMIVSSSKFSSLVDGWKMFATRRLARIVPIYWIATTVKVVAMVYFAKQVLHTELDFLFIIKSYVFLPSYNPIDRTIQPLLGVGWTLVFEMFFYALFTLALFLKVSPLKFVGAIILLICLGSLFRERFVDMQEFPLLYFLLDSVMLDFVLGMALGWLFKRGTFLGLVASILAVGVGLLSIIFDCFGVAGSTPPVISIGFASFFVLWGCVSLEQSGRISIPNVFVFLGAASYSTYLFHPLIAPVVPALLRRLGLVYPNLAMISAIVFAILATALIYSLIERPITNVLAARLSRVPRRLG